ncbi:3-keto-disaccharide hydrolase [Foetidibacter luteolus]|uniref:3-keto-disaccharide hydrolase n=1 Tax=Foetidibacter luteolus TaxID=2608880 RepID=UPI00129BA0C1|nr:DUF1080 domain-containing protein [Foetidibacter luteolus]
MKLLLLSAGISLSLLACQSGEQKAADTDSTTTAATTPQDTGWISLFDGQSLAGWHTYGKTGTGAAWKVDSGTLFLNATDKKAYETGGGDIITDGVYGNFHLKYDWKISKDGNSGVIFYVQEDTAKFKNTYNSGLEMQVLDNDGHPDGKIPNHRAGNLYDLVAANPETAKGPGEWNQAEIISNNGSLELYLNGTKVVTTTLWDDNWTKMIAGSKFKTMPGWGTFKEGHIALQDHGNDVWYKNIVIKKL